MSNIKAIQTKYRGYYFRSRLEARWAVFFDAAKMQWEYEPEGFEFDGIKYLPDFYLPDIGCYFEVKGTSEYNIEVLQRFAWQIGRPLIVAEGQIPDSGASDCGKTVGLRFLHPSKPEDWPNGFIDDVAYGYQDMFLCCDNCGKIEVMNQDYCTMKDNCGCGDKSARWMPLSNALKAARSARFEHKNK